MHESIKALLRVFRKPRKWISKKLRPAKEAWNDLIVPYLYEKSIKGILYVDETGSFQGTRGQFYVGATGVFILKGEQRQFEAHCQKYRDALAIYGTDREVEIHAVEWIHHRIGFPANTHSHSVVLWLRRFLTHSSHCNTVQVINVIADSTSPRSVKGNNAPTPGQLEKQMRRDVFEKLFEEFEKILAAQSIKGHVWVDENRLSELLSLFEDMSRTIPRQPIAPVPVRSHEHHGVQLADVCAYFMLQQVSPSVALDSRDASDGLNDIASLCPDPNNPGMARVHFV
jgi:hypothetical protein